ncbi:hypothetical protein [Paenibacillus aquistagni]|uniref:Uncharacterized protein n=1 Tax=Paenibacillus aquistagni TaxID=1852522 RepID=A0A1X7LL87_9BACL|nr:hypothetical protein [Paenibacillus aquistagni]SMG54244.1 hypothetical protein SAMN06295960_3682 [Paenibacillus aquistagni]
MKKVAKKTSRKKSQAVSVISIVAVLAMLFIALPTIPLREGFSLASIFGVVWALFAVLIIGAHLYRLLKVDEDTEKRMKAIKKEKIRKLERRMMGDS